MKRIHNVDLILWRSRPWYGTYTKYFTFKCALDPEPKWLIYGYWTWTSFKQYGGYSADTKRRLIHLTFKCDIDREPKWFLTSAYHGGSVRLTLEPSFGQTETERQTYGRWRIKKRDRPVNWDMHWFLSMPCYSVCHMWWALLYLALWQTIRLFEIFRLCRQINANLHITTINAFISKKSSD